MVKTYTVKESSSVHFKRTHPIASYFEEFESLYLVSGFPLDTYTKDKDVVRLITPIFRDYIYLDYI